ncbi:MAG: MBL fold metallo-hydrolase [Candidatus Vogelbacteria bacterium]|nr:MBL fold metallo-hydrolase [Candidatus Vogelbacteria bacterium]
MVITYYGHASYKVQFGDSIIAFNPVSKKSDYKTSSFGADIALISINDENYNGKEQVAYGSREPFVIEGPGEYEVGGIYVRGFGIEQSWGNATKVNTVYSVLFEGINICNLGALALEKISPEIIESLGEIDILFVPIFGEPELDAKNAAKLSAELQAKIIIPMYSDSGVKSKDNLKLFLKEIGEDNVDTLDKLTIKKKDLDGKEGDVIVINPVA